MRLIVMILLIYRTYVVYLEKIKLAGLVYLLQTLPLKAVQTRKKIGGFSMWRLFFCLVSYSKILEVVKILPKPAHKKALHLSVPAHNKRRRAWKSRLCANHTFYGEIALFGFCMSTIVSLLLNNKPEASKKELAKKFSKLNSFYVSLCGFRCMS